MAVTYNFDPDNWYENQRRLLEHRLASSQIGQDDYRQQPAGQVPGRDRGGIEPAGITRYPARGAASLTTRGSLCGQQRTISWVP